MLFFVFLNVMWVEEKKNLLGSFTKDFASKKFCRCIPSLKGTGVSK